MHSRLGSSELVENLGLRVNLNVHEVALLPAAQNRGS